jgi:uncharacterized protein YndB with AHSA1/START domain
VTGSQSEGRKQSARPGKIVKKVWIRASKDVVFQALTDSRDLVQWFCDRASLEAREGGELAAYWKGAAKNGQKGRALITRLVPGSMIEFLWVDEGDGAGGNLPPHTHSYEIRAKSGMTELVMTDSAESDLDSDEVQILDHGWNSVLVDLRDHCERKERSAKLRSPLRSKASNKNPE